MKHLFRIYLLLMILLYVFVTVFGGCPLPPKVKDGDYRPKKATYKTNAFVKYSCSAGFRLIGNKKIKCQKNSHWPATPVCLEQLCPSPPPVTQALLATPIGPSPPGSCVTFYCVPGFKIVGPRTITCKNDLSWSEMPCCVPNECGDPPTVADATFTPEPPYSSGDMVTYSCTNVDTHELEGPATITCQANERWSASPTCVLRECGDPPTVVAATFTPAPPYTPTETVTYTCIAKHTLEGPATVTCQADGRWTAGPVCITTCCPPPSIPLGTFSPIKDSYLPSDQVTYKCCNGITMTGSFTTNTCGSDGTWSVTRASLPSCEPTVCPPPPSILHGFIFEVDRKLTYAINELIHYNCNYGPKPGKAESNTCGPDGLWTDVFADICDE